MNALQFAPLIKRECKPLLKLADVGAGLVDPAEACGATTFVEHGEQPDQRPTRKPMPKYMTGSVMTLLLPECIGCRGGGHSRRARVTDNDGVTTSATPDPLSTNSPLARPSRHSRLWSALAGDGDLSQLASSEKQEATLDTVSMERK
jgi:hypothetical protein